jgi:hypothetical protein
MAILTFGFSRYRHYHEIATGAVLEMVFLAGDNNPDEDWVL